MGGVKTTVEIPNSLFRKAKAAAADQGILPKDLLTEAVRQHLQRNAGSSARSKPPSPAWMSAFGGLRNLHKDTMRINRILAKEFEQLGEDEWR
jgi:hypothetical protein